MKYKTGKKELILELLSEKCNSAYSIEQICERITDAGKGKSTVYRLVSELVDDGVIRRLTDGKTRRVTYQFVGGEPCHRHMHLKCNECGKLIHLDEGVSRDFEDKVRSIGGFAIEDGGFIYGKCRECIGGADK